jgi:8-oxo-dGTP pyrophosphatase MutT (NUDIX family)
MTIYKQAAAIPFRIRDDQIEILLITSRNGKKWIIPKGIIEPGDSARKTAAKETIEEAGVSGVIDLEEVGAFKYKKWGGICEVKVFSMHIKKTMDYWLEMDFRIRRWYRLKDAVSRVKPKKVRKIIIKWAEENGFE